MWKWQNIVGSGQSLFSFPLKYCYFCPPHGICVCVSHLVEKSCNIYLIWTKNTQYPIYWFASKYTSSMLLAPVLYNKTFWVNVKIGPGISRFWSGKPDKRVAILFFVLWYKNDRYQPFVWLITELCVTVRIECYVRTATMSLTSGLSHITRSCSSCSRGWIMKIVTKPYCTACALCPVFMICYSTYVLTRGLAAVRPGWAPRKSHLCRQTGEVVKV